MKLAVSNLSWRNDEKMTDLVDIFARYSIGCLEIAESKKNFHNIWLMKDVVSMQSILFGSKENLFTSAEERDILMEKLMERKLIAKSVGCRHIVFGCPNNRRALSERSSTDQIIEAVTFFRTLSEYIPEVTIGFEPVSTRYNCNFINNFNDAVNFVKLVDHPSFKVNLDLANIHDSDVTIDEIKQNIDYVSHIHISEIDLSEIRTSEILKELIEFVESDKMLEDRLVFSIEAKDLTFEQLERSIQFVKSFSNSSESL